MRETESLLIAAQNATIKTNYIKTKIDNMQQNRKCRLCWENEEIINSMISKFIKLAQNEYKAWLDGKGNCAKDWNLTTSG